MSLLFQDVGLRLPLPNQELTVLRRSKREPFTRLVDGNNVNVALGYTVSFVSECRMYGAG